MNHGVDYLIVVAFIASLVYSSLIFGLQIANADTTSILRPTADGTDDSASWTNTTGVVCNTVNCYTEIIETSGASCTNSDGDTSYVEASINGAAQTFDVNLSSIPDNSTITQIDIAVCQKRVGTAPGNKFQTRRCIDGACANSGANLGASGAYAENTQSHTGLNITKTSATDLEIGVAITDTNNKMVRVSQISATITYTPPATPTPTPTPTPDKGGAVAPTSVVITGQAYPESKVELLRKSDADELYRPVPQATSTVLADGTFKILVQLGELLGDVYLFVLRAEDKDGRKTGIIAMDTNLFSAGYLGAKAIFFPPTIGFENALVTLGKEVKMKGYAAPSSKIEFEIDGIISGETKSGTNGYWSLATSTASLRIGDHRVRVRQLAESGSTSDFSVSQTFRVSLLVLPKADFNNDGKVNITDFGIFLFRWGSGDKALRTKIDMNEDGKVDISDLSIFLKAMRI